MTRSKDFHFEPSRTPWMGSVAAAVMSLLVLDAASVRAAEPPLFNRDVRPILAENCFPCHGPDSAARKAGLRLDRREEAIQEVIVPGDPEHSPLIERIFAAKASKRMPPAKTQKELTAAQKEMLRRWIAAGAVYQLHWSLVPPQRPPVPTVQQKGWVRNPLDAFILAALEKQGLRPAPEADRRTLARRVSLDLTGLPPTPAAVEAFVHDPAPDAYEHYVDRLLASPHWGEHRGRYWLDAARYADTHGIHFDNYREIWSYRDWVIGAFNRNLPFDQFTIEQLAGDLLPHPTLAQEVASGFNRCNITTNEGGAIAEEYLVLYTRDRTETTSQVWMGLTAGCAVCHDHKFDPLSQREFYSLAAFFNNTTQAAMDGNVQDTAPTMVVPRPADRPRWEALSQELADVRRQAAERRQTVRPEFDRWLADARPETVTAMLPRDGLRLHGALDEGGGRMAHFTVDGTLHAVTLPPGSAWGVGHVSERAFQSKAGAGLKVTGAGDFDKDQAFSFGAWVRLPRDNATGSLLARTDDGANARGWDLWVEGSRVGIRLIHDWPGDALKVITHKPIPRNQWNHVFVTYDGSGKAAGVQVYVNGSPQATEAPADSLKGTVRTPASLRVAERGQMSRLNGVLVQDVRVYDRALAAAEVDRLARGVRAAWLVSRLGSRRAAAEKDELETWWLMTFDEPSRILAGKLGPLQQEEAVLKSRGTIAYVMKERSEPPGAYVLFRGEYEKRRDPVKPETPHALPPLPPELPHNRLGFAQWLVRPEHPLTARVTVNRFWQEVFGTGLVRTSGDFGVAGELPSHPELLDWLAVDFRESGWDVKRFFRMLVTSATYRQAAVATPEKQEKDPQNRLLSRGPRFRMDGEMIRDYALAASGLLVPKVGGPSVKPYQPEGVWEAVAMIGSNTRDYKQDHGDALYRRSLYTFWKRAAPPASMDVFNAPSRETCTMRRERTDTPLQALVTLNDPQFVEAARHLAQAALKEDSGQEAGRIDFIARRLLSRPLRAEEAKVVRATAENLLTYYQAHPEDAKKLLAVGETKADPNLDTCTLAAWTMVVNELMNLDEVLNK
jgi:hypothetical protein